MTDEDLEAWAQELQSQPDPKKLFTPPPWRILTEHSKEYWRAKARTMPRQRDDAPPWAE